MPAATATATPPAPSHVYVLNTEARLWSFARTMGPSPDEVARAAAVTAGLPPGSMLPVVKLEHTTLKLLPGINIVSAEDAQAFRLDLILRDCKKIALFDPTASDEFTCVHWAERTASAKALLAWRSNEKRPNALAAIDKRLAMLPAGAGD